MPQGQQLGDGDWLANMPEIPCGNDGHCCRTFNEERDADAGDDMPEVRDGLGSPFCLGRAGTSKSGGLRIAA